MKALFLNPPYLAEHGSFSREQRSPAITKSGTLYYPKWLAHAAGVALRDGHSVEFVDAPARSFRYSERMIEELIAAKGVDALVCSTSIPSIWNDVEVVESLQARFPGLRSLLVGIGASVLHGQIFSKSEKIEAVAVREYDYTVRDWLAAVQSGASLESVDGIIWRRGREIVANAARKPVENLDELPFVSEVYRKYLNINDYFYGHSRHPLVVFDTSRGCPFQCTFCVYPQVFSGHRMRYRSISNVVDEFEFCAREFPKLKTIMLEDDTFIVDKPRTLQLADELIRRNNRIPFDSNNRADLDVDLKFLKRLKKAGARLFCVGFESGNNSVLDHMHKNLNLDKALDFMRKCRAAGIMVHGCFMVGNLNETKETLRDTLRLALRLRPDTAQFFPIMVYPGTTAYEEAKLRGFLMTEDYTQWLTPDGLHQSVVRLPNLSSTDLVEFCDRARRRFYLNPDYLMRKLWQSVRSPGELKRNLMGFSTLVKYLFRGTYPKDRSDSNPI